MAGIKRSSNINRISRISCTCILCLSSIYPFHSMNRVLPLPVCIAVGISLFTRSSKQWSFTARFLPSTHLHSHLAESHKQNPATSVNSLTLFNSQLVHLFHITSTSTIVIMATSKRSKRPAEETASSEGHANPPKKKQCRKPTCVVCGTKKYFNQFPGQVKVNSHEHGANVCRSCYVSHLKVEIDSKTWDEVACPECPVRLTYNEVENMADPEDFTK
jgi:hypothetical protein